MKPKKVLIVEDENELRELLVELLDRAGIEAKAVKNGIEALKLIEEEEFGTVISDYRMPVMDGLQLLYEFCVRDMKIPFIIISAYPEDDKLLIAPHLGVSELIIKPFEAKVFVEKIANFLNHSSEEMPGIEKIYKIFNPAGKKDETYH